MSELILIHMGGVLASSCANAEVTDGRTSPTLMARAGTGGNQLPLVVYEVYEVIETNDRKMRERERIGTGERDDEAVL